MAVVPFGGGTSVVGGLEASREGFEAVVSLDLGALDGVLGVDERSLTAVLRAGPARCREADRALAPTGCTLAHVPQSYEWATVGGCVATRSAGQSSTGHGRIDENVVAVRLAAPAGELATLGGPERRRPVAARAGRGLGGRARRDHPGRAAGAPAAGGARTRAGRALVRRRAATRCGGSSRPGSRPTSRGSPTRPRRAWGSRWPGRGGDRRAGAAASRLLGYGEGCLVVLGWEGEARPRARRARPPPCCCAGRRAAARAGPGESWARARFAARTCATTCWTAACSWRRSRPRRRGGRSSRCATRSSARCAARSAARCVGCHVSHLYRRAPRSTSPCSPRQEAEDPRGQWLAAKAAATDAIVAAGATITHHHAVGRDHAPWLEAEVGGLGVELLRTLKERCDPGGGHEPRRARALRRATGRRAACPKHDLAGLLGRARCSRRARDDDLARTASASGRSRSPAPAAGRR